MYVEFVSIWVIYMGTWGVSVTASMNTGYLVFFYVCGGVSASVSVLYICGVSMWTCVC